MNITRRAFLGSSAALAIAPALPFSIPAAPVAQAVEAVAPATTIWVGGHAGEYDWQPFHALTKKDAFRELMLHHGYGTAEEIEDMLELPIEEVEETLKADEIYMQRAVKMDGLLPDQIKAHHWIRSGLGACCDRCSSECCDGARAIKDRCICGDCLTIADRIEDGDVDEAVELLAEHLAENDLDRIAVSAMLDRDNDMNVITEEIWRRAMDDAREAAHG